MAFPDSWMHDLMNRNEIVSVISEYTRLSPKGSRMWGLCPFHPERDASFSVTPDKQLFHCFSCKAGGSVIQFIMQAESLGYVDAVRFLAQRAGMNMPDEVDDEKLRKEKALRDRLYSANRDAAKFFHQVLLSDDGLKARQYLIGRGIDGNTATRFGLGYSPDDWDALYKHMTSLGYKRDELISAGLCIKGRQDESRTFDFFHGRLMFPVISASGTVLAFGARVLDGDHGAKYMNTGDTLIYNKRHNIYAINLMKGKKLDELIMVEGYMDVISLHQYGIDNAVASLGTALTSQQVRLMSRFAKRAVYAYDGDAAGQKAMLRGIDILTSGGVEPRVIVIPGGNDPDEFVRKYGREAFLKLRDSSLTSVQFKLESIAAEETLETPDGRQSYAKRASALLSGLDPVERERYVKVISEKSGFSVEVIREQCGLARPSESENALANKVGSAGYKRPLRYEKRVKSEIMLLGCYMKSRHDAAAIEQLDGFSPALFTEPGLADFFRAVKKAYESSQTVDLLALVSGYDGEGGDAIGSAAAQADDIASPVETARDCINSIIKEDLDSEIRRLSDSYKLETDPAKRADILKKQTELLIKSRSLS